MMSIQVCRDPSDAVALYLPQRLYLKSFARLNISVQLPPHKVHGKSISNWELMEKLRKMIQPDSFSILKVSKHSTEVIRFDAELEARDKLERVLARLEDRIIQLNDYPEPLKVKVSEAKSDFPKRHDWDSFYRDASDMDEMKPGERPDTVHLVNLPIRWFVHDNDRDEDARPSENLIKKIFEKYGTVRQVDVPASDPYRMQMKAAIRGITTPPQEATLYFEGYIQFSEYVSFVRCMDALRGKKLMRKRDDIAEWCGIKVDFDKTKHMTDAAVKRRAIVRERLVARQRARDEEEKQEKERIAKKEAKERQKIERGEREKLEKMKEREERRKKKQLAKLMARDDVDLNSKVMEEQRKLLKAQKKLQAIRLIEELFRRIELRPELRRNGQRGEVRYSAGDSAARARLVAGIKREQEDALEKQRNQLKNAIDGRIVIRSALETRKPKRDSSISSESSREDRHKKRIKSEKLTTPEREMEYNKAATGMFSLPPPYGYGYPYPAYPYTPQTSMYYPVRGAYYPPPGAEGYGPRRPWRGRPRARPPRMPHFNGPDANHLYYKYFKKLSEAEFRNDHDDRDRGRDRVRSRSRSRDRDRSRSRSLSRSRRRSYSRSRSRSRSRSHRRSYSRSRSRSRRSRSRSRRSRSRSRRSRSHHRRSRSRSRRSRSKHTPTPKAGDKQDKHDKAASAASAGPASPASARARRSKSWSLPKRDEKSWSKSPKN